MSNNLKSHLYSSAVTFASAFLLALGASLSSGSLEWSKSAILALLLAAARSAGKVVIEKFVPPSALGIAPTHK